MRMSYKALLLMLVSIFIAGSGLYKARQYYSLYKESIVFPVNLKKYESANKNIPIKVSQKRLILFGDSRVSMWSPEPKIDRVQVINRGISGETTAQLIARYQQDVIELSPDVIVIQAGINDLVAAGVLPEKSELILKSIKRNLVTLVERGKASGAKVVLMTIIRPSDPPWYRRLVWSGSIVALVNKTNNFIRNLPKQYPVKILDIDNVLYREPEEFTELYATDTLHVNSAAYAAINMALIEFIE